MSAPPRGTGSARTVVLAAAMLFLLGAATAARAVCGDGIVDVGEECDGGACCSSTCILEPASTICRASTDPCDAAEYCTGSSPACPPDTGTPDTDGDGVCDALDNCDTVPNPSQANADGDALGDACDPCTNVVPTQQGRVKLSLGRLLAPAGDDTLAFRGFFVNVPRSPVINPVVHGMRFLLTDVTGAVPLDVTIDGGAYDPTSKVGWKVNSRGTSWTYKNAGTVTALVDGIRKMQLRAFEVPAGMYKVVVKGRPGDYAIDLAHLPLTATVVIDPPLATSGQCGEATFAMIPPARPSCAWSNDGDIVKCQ